MGSEDPWSSYGSGWFTLLSYGARVLRWLNAHRFIGAVKHKATLSVFSGLHQDVLHRVRRLGYVMSQRDVNVRESTLIAEEICNHCCTLMSGLLELSRNQLHCCFKVVAPPDDNDDDRVATWVRSKPLDLRPLEKGPDNAHLVHRNSVWSALFGRDDGDRHWQAFPCFACNDLVRKGTQFVCDRENWQKYYRSTLVFPIRYIQNGDATEFGCSGFIAFDSPQVGAFMGVPDIYDHTNDPTRYLDQLDGSAAFHLGAIIADTLGAVLGPSYDVWKAPQTPRKGEA